MTRKIFIPNMPTRYDAATGSRVPSLDLNPAAQHGELIKVTEGPFRPEDVPEALKQLRWKLEAEYNSGDLILAVGDVVMTAAAIAYAQEFTDHCCVLRWDRYKRAYDIVEVVL